MSTISLMPIGKKFSIKRGTELKTVSQLSTAKNLTDAGILISGKLILDENVVIRVDGISSELKGSTNVKLSVFPHNGKMGNVYVDFQDLDGLSWNPVVEEEKPTPPPIRRVDVSMDATEVHTDYVFHEAIGRTFNADTELKFLVNPRSLEMKEIKKREFKYSYTQKIASAIVRDGKNVFSYEITASVKHLFKLSLDSELGILEAQRDNYQIMLEIERSGYRPKNSTTIYTGDPNEYNFSAYKNVITTYLKDLHKI